MNKIIFWSAWSFSGVGFLFFFALHTLPVLWTFIALWFVAAIMRMSSFHISGGLRFLALISCVVLVWSEYEGLRSVEAAAGLFALLTVLKLWESKTARDGFLFFLIFQLMMIAQYLLLESLWILGFMVLSTLGMCAIFMNLQSEQWQSLSIVHPGKRAVLFRLMSAAVVLAAALFFVFPRSNFTLFVKSFKEKTHPMTGFSSELRPGRITQIMEDDAIVFRARFSKATPRINRMYWHGASLTDTDGFNWDRNFKVTFNSSAPQKDEGLFHYEADMADPGDGPLFVLSPASSFETKTRGIVRWRGINDPIIKSLTSQKTRWSGALSRAKIPLEDNERLLEALRLPLEVKSFVRESFPEFENMSLSQILTATDSIFNKNFSYSLRPREYSGSPLEQLREFLLVRKIGICEHFASAQAVILRAFGFPAVVAVGFHGGAYNDLGDYWNVRGRDAHAWVIAYDQVEGWIRHDPTMLVAPDRFTIGASGFMSQWLEQRGESDQWLKITRIGWVNDIVKALDSAYYSLNIAFINYDAESQRNFLEQFGLKNWKRSWLKWICFLMGLTTIGGYWLYQRRVLRDPWSSINRMYQSFVKKLQEFDLNAVSSMPPLSLRDQLIKKKFPTQTVLFLETYISLKYDSLETPSKEQLKHLRSALRESFKEMKGRE